MNITCPFCGGSCCADSDSSQPCVACNGQGVVVDSGPPRVDWRTERFRVSGAATERVVVVWQDNTETTIYRYGEGR